MSVDLRTRYLGIELANPLVVSACPLTEDLVMLRNLEAAGAAAVVLPSLFQEQIEHDEQEVQAMQEFGAESFPEALDYFPELNDYNTGPDAYLQLIESSKKTVSIPVIASLNGTSKSGWERYARLIEQAGADALELNIYFIPTDPGMTGGEIESRYVELVRAVRESVSIPLAVKLGPFFSALPNMARRLTEAGADGLVLFNRFLQPDIDPETLGIRPKMELSTSQELRLPLRWVAILHGRLRCSLAVTSGVHTSTDVVKCLLAGADVVMTASAVLQHGPKHLETLLGGARQWMQENEYASVDQMQGSMSQQNCPDPDAFERTQYMKMLASYSGYAL
jgi:dihydroorotate dehydrogenase (fumarate)